MRGVLFVGLVAVGGCGGEHVTSQPPPPQPFGGTASVVGNPAGAGGTSGSAPLGEEALPGDPPTAMPAGPITAIVPSAGCGKAFDYASGQTFNMLTQGEKAADCADKLMETPVCGAWKKRRYYSVFLPIPYDASKAYPLVFQGPGCGGGSKDVYPLNNGVGNTVIRVGLAPGPNSTGHATNENQGCFDTHEGDDSIDWVFYENLYDRLNADLCFDRNRVFALGNSSGGWMANELGCKYAGDALRPVRGVGGSRSGLPTSPAYVPTCSSAPLAGFWVHEVDDQTTPFTSVKAAIDRAMALDSCAPSTGYDGATFANFPIGGGVADDTCKTIQGCATLYPLVVCPLPGHSQGSHDSQINNGFSTFVKLFSAGPFLTR